LVANSISVKGRRQDGKRFHRQLALHSSDTPATHLAPESLFLNFTGCEQDLGLGWEVRVALAADGSLIQWKVSCSNHADEALYLEAINLLQPLQDRQGNFQLDCPDDADLRFYANGWQSWSYSGTYSSHDRMRSSNLGFLQEPMVLNPGTPKFRRRGKFSSDMFAALADARSGQGIVLGFLSQKQQFGVLTADLRRSSALRAWAVCDDVRLDPGASLETDWFAVGLIDAHAPFPLDPYLLAAAHENDVKAMQPPPVGWCSWYHYYQDISEQKIMANLEQIQRIRESTPLNLFQIDDGFQEQVGDWLTFNEKFPHGVKPLADAIKQADMTPGIWLAPFIVHPRSRLAREHPDWLLRRRNGSLARAGFVWNALGLALDLTVPAALEYAVEVIRTAVQDWGFTYLKLDFLYAAALKGQYRDRTKTRAQVLRMAMHAVREAAGKDTHILGCGLPLGSALGLVDFMRVSADVGGHWAPDYFKLGFLFKREPHMPSARNAIHNTLTRAMFHNIWWVNDPDCLLVREDTALSLAEVRSLATAIAMTGGSILVSDDMQHVSPERLRIMQALIPPLNQRALVLDWLEPGTPARMRLDLQDGGGQRHLLSFANWDDQSRRVRLMPEDFGLDPKSYAISAFWQEQSWIAEEGGALFDGMLQAHETILLIVRTQDGLAHPPPDFRRIAPV
jgi:alpha-galactosidase